MTPRVTASTPFEQWPLFLSVREFAIVAGRSVGAVRNALQHGKAWPPPVRDEFGYLKPYRFDRDLVIQALRGDLPRPRRLAHPRRIVTPPSLRRSA
jgi:hypothetical protein